MTIDNFYFVVYEYVLLVKLDLKMKHRFVFQTFLADFTGDSRSDGLCVPKT